jgi:uncharacterized protein with HEPN domain
MSNKDYGNLKAIEDACTKIFAYTKPYTSADELFANPLSFDAILMNFIVIGEAVSRMSTSLLDSNHHIPWVEIKAFRNIIAHNYFGVDVEEVWQIIEDDLPVFLDKIKQIKITPTS